MRIDLKVPYADKDQAKMLGAKWDSVAKTWYVIDVVNFWPLMKWMPKHLTEPNKTVVVVKVEQKVAKSNKSRQVKPKKSYEKAMKRLSDKKKDIIYGPVTPRTDFSLRDTGCDCPPWDWCQHNPDPAKLNTACANGHKPDYSHVARQIEADNMAHIRSILAE